MTQDGKADKGHDWLDTWKVMEDLYTDHPDKVKAIGESKRITLGKIFDSRLAIRRV
jgi:hypothetical protein